MKEGNTEWDLFICHASEDKEDIVRPLVEALIEKGFHVWYDEFTLTIGDSLRRSIDKGLAQSKYGLVILSPNFFAKNWPQTELDGLAARERNGEKVVLPVWHNVDERYIRQFSPTLADKVSVSTKKGIDYIVEKIFKAVKPGKIKGSVANNSTPEESKVHVEDCMKKIYNPFEDLEIKEIAVEELKRLGARKQLMEIAAGPWVHHLIKRRARDALKSMQ